MTKKFTPKVGQSCLLLDDSCGLEYPARVVDTEYTVIRYGHIEKWVLIVAERPNGTCQTVAVSHVGEDTRSRLIVRDAPVVSHVTGTLKFDIGSYVHCTYGVVVELTDGSPTSVRLCDTVEKE